MLFRSCLDGKRLSCSSVAVPTTIFQEDAVEPKTGIKFPAFLEDDSSPATTVYPSCFLGAFYVILQASFFNNAELRVDKSIE